MSDSHASTTISISPILRDEIRVKKAVNGESYDQFLRRRLELKLDDE